MAFSTLNQLRALLNTELGRSDATTTPWGTDTDCNTFIQMAIRRLWPRMARLQKESITPVEGATGYTLTTLYDLVAIEQVDSDGIFQRHVPSWQLYVDESADPVVRQLVVPELDTASGYTAIGYAPYAVPATGTDQCDLPSRLEHVVITGAKAEAFRRRMNEYVDFENRGLANPVTSVQQNEIERIYLATKAEFDQLIRENQRNLILPKRARLTVTR